MQNRSPFQTKEEVFDPPAARSAATVAAHSPIGGYDTVTGDHDRDGIAPIRLADRSRRAIAHAMGDIEVAGGRAVGNLEKLAPDFALVGRTPPVERQVELSPLAGKVLAQLPLQVLGLGVRVHARGRAGNLAKMNGPDAALGNDQGERTDR